jgi:hypothetical protein
MMNFEKAFDAFILHQRVSGRGFQLLTSIRQKDGYFRDIGGYYTVFENGYQLMINGESLGTTAIQEALILDPESMVIARDTEDMRRSIADTHNSGNSDKA